MKFKTPGSRQLALSCSDTAPRPAKGKKTFIKQFFETTEPMIIQA